MVTLRVFRGEALLGELDVRGGAAEIGDREGDAVRLGDLGIVAPPGAGGRIEQRRGAWVFVPRGGNEAGREVPLRSGDRVALGDGAVEIAIGDAGPLVDLTSIPADEGAPLPGPAAAPRPGTSAARLVLLADFLRRLEEGTTSDEVLAGALDGAFRLVGAERGIVAMREADGKGLRVVASRNLAGEDPRRALSRRVLEAVLGEGRDVFTGNAPVDIPTVSVNLRDIRAICALPLKVRGKVRGVLYVDRGATSPPFAEDDFAFLQLLSSLVARRLDEEERLKATESERRVLADRLARREADDERDLGWTSPAMRRVRGEAERLLKAFQGRSLPVLITGESGTGKEVLARWLHAHLDGGKGPFVAVNCAAIPHDLAESELFGIEQGVASGVLRRLGKFQQASGGTLFLDEIGEMSPSVQSKVLRALESRKIVRVGGRDEIPVDLRIVSATNRDLQGSIRDGRFREDLYWRLCGVEVRMPPLRERREDIPVLCGVFTEKFAEEFGVAPPIVEPDAMARLAAYHWPGNVRELRQRLGALTAFRGGGAIRVEDLPREIREGTAASPPPPASPAPSEAAASGPLASLADVEREHIRRVLAAVGGDRQRAADVLGIHRKTLVRKLTGEVDEAAQDPPTPSRV